VRIAIGERVEAGAEHDVLAGAVFDEADELVFGKPAADDHERPDRARGAPAALARRVGKLRGRLGTDDSERPRIVEHRACG
jgi:hypothetical protein